MKSNLLNFTVSYCAVFILAFIRPRAPITTGEFLSLYPIPADLCIWIVSQPLLPKCYFPLEWPNP